jgi:hypothetical protein
VRRFISAELSMGLMVRALFVCKSMVAAIPSFHGYYEDWNSRVGKASTVSFVWTSVS